MLDRVATGGPCAALALGSLGRRASHGGIRLAPAHAAALFSLARSRGGAAAVSRD